MQRYQEVVALNNQGIGMVYDDLTGSLSVLRQALEAFAGLLADSAEFDACQKSAAAPISMLPPSSCMKTPAVIVQNTFVQLIDLSPTHSVYSQDPLIGLSVAYAIIVFNMANLYHCLGLHHQDMAVNASGRDMLRTAQTLYARCQTTLQSIGLVQTCHLSGIPVIDTMAMATLNNLAQITDLFSEYETSRVHCEQLLAYATSGALEDGDPETAAWLDWQKAVFLKNVLSLWPPAIAAAA